MSFVNKRPSSHVLKMLGDVLRQEIHLNADITSAFQKQGQKLSPVGDLERNKPALDEVFWWLKTGSCAICRKSRAELT